MDLPTLVAGRYRLERLLGQGGFGSTYAARDLQSDEWVAVKALDLRHVKDWKAVELFEREGRVLAQLDHPGIPRYVEFVAVEGDHAGYLVQELAAGQSLDTRLERGQRFTHEEV
ncbi:MAG: protein kinase, partial [Myxococcota bacterium]|nr:protein kinase [Myxococcota bacterium]